MELHKLKSEDLRALDAAKLRETEADVRKQIVDMRMDIYTAKSAQAAKVQGLRKSLARLLTVRNELLRKNPPAAAPKAEKPAAAPKAKAKAAPKAKAKAATPKAEKPAAKAAKKTATKKK